MSDSDDAQRAGAAAAWVWANWDLIAARLAAIRSWFLGGKDKQPSAGILILGPGGAGKTTLAGLLSEEEYNPLRYLPGDYKESRGIETFQLQDAPNVEIVVPPGQIHRREATWGSIHADLAAGRFRGIIMLAAYGYHSFMISYKEHELYENDKEKFLEGYLAERQGEELAVLRQLAPHAQVCPNKLWMLTLVAKQDLWWPKHGDVERHYRQGDYAAAVQNIMAQRGSQRFHHDFIFASLVISNFITGEGEILKPNAAGYDQRLQIKSLRQLFESVDGLRQWEAGS